MWLTWLPLAASGVLLTIAARVPTMLFPGSYAELSGTDQGILRAVSSVDKDHASFDIVGDSGVPAMHAALLQDGTVIFLNKVESSTGLKLGNGRFAYSSIYDPDSHRVIPLKVRSNAFCAAGAFLNDGRLVAIGGNEPLLWLDPTVGNGLRALQFFDLSKPEEGWTEPQGRLASRRWYATAQVLDDGKVFVAAGTSNGTNPYANENINPTYETLDANGSSQGKNIEMDILTSNKPYWMYPFVHLLKDGSLFVFVSKSSQIFDAKKNQVLKSLPALDGLYRTYPNTGSSVMFPLRPEQDYEPTIMVCGGGGWQGIDSPGDATCGIIKPLSNEPQWNITTMPGPRCMVEGVLLLDGTVLWINGVATGAQGFGLSGTPALDALIFHPDTNSWVIAGKSSIARVYHSVALMLLDGTILIAGSNPNEMPIWLEDVDPGNQYRKFPTEMRVERWTPPYLLGKLAKQRPANIVIGTNRIKLHGPPLKILFDSDSTKLQVEVILYHGGFVTHSLHMGQIMVHLEVLHVETTQQKRKTVIVKQPELSLAPGPYVVYLVVDGVPGIGQFVSVEL